MMTPEEIKKLFLLARIEITDANLEKFPGEISSILDYVGHLSEVAVRAEETAETGRENISLRADEVRLLGEGEREALRAAFPDRKDGYLRTKNVF